MTDYEKKYKTLLIEIGTLRQLVGECNLTQDQIYKKLDKIVPLFTKEQKKELDEQINKSIKIE